MNPIKKKVFFWQEGVGGGNGGREVWARVNFFHKESKSKKKKFLGGGGVG